MSNYPLHPLAMMCPNAAPTIQDIMIPIKKYNFSSVIDTTPLHTKSNLVRLLEFSYNRSDKAIDLVIFP